jgi:hypothetical protein
VVLASIALSLALLAVNAETSTATISTPRRVLAATTALVPGLVVHGLGHLVAGDAETAIDLMWIEGAGVLLGAAGGSALALSGASRTVILPATLATIGGAGLFILSWLADLYGVLADGGIGIARTKDPTLEIRLGLAYVHDPTFDYRIFLTHDFELWLGSFALEPRAWIALDDDNARLGVAARYRVLEASVRGSYFDVRAGWIHHRYSLFSIDTLELELGGRLDLSWISRSLGGAFVESTAGVALELDQFREVELEGRGLLLARFGFGLYLGRGGSDGSEILVYYDHRHDGYAGGTKLRGLISGVPGHFGLAARWDFSPSLGVVLDAATGSAHVIGLSLVYREGAR